MPEGDLILKQVWATIDRRTTLTCLHAAGQIRLVEEPFETDAGTYDSPPFHVYCRSISVPYMTGFVSDIRKEANAELLARPKKHRRRGPDGEIGGYVPPPAPFQGPPAPAVPVPPLPAEVEKAFVSVRPAMSQETQEGIVDWTLGGNDLNGPLRQGARFGDLDEVQQRVYNGLASAAEDSPIDFVTHRVVDSDVTSRWKLGDVVADRGFATSSPDEVFVREFADTLDAPKFLHVQVPAGRVEVAFTGGAESAAGEAAFPEFVFMPGQKMEVFRMEGDNVWLRAIERPVGPGG